MSEGARGFRPKSPEEIENQFNLANFVLNHNQDILLPPSTNREDILKMSANELKKKFPKRYEIYTRLIQELRHSEDEALVTLADEELVRMRNWLIAVNSVDTYVRNHQEKIGPQVLRGERQLNVFEDTLHFLEEGGTEGYYKLPTGFGKTVLFVEMCEAMNLRTLVVVPTIDLLEQTAEKFDEFAPDLEYGKIFGDEKVPGKQITLITYASLVKQMEEGVFEPNIYELLILDEAHAALGEGASKQVKEFKNAIKLGFTATPIYEFEEKELSQLLNHEIHRLPIKEAVEEGYLCSFRTIVARTQADMSKIKYTSEDAPNVFEVEEAVNIESANRGAVQLYLEEFSGETIFLNCGGIKHATEMTRLFNEAGIKTEIVTGEMDAKKIRKPILDRAKSGETLALAGARLLIAGIDVKRASVCFNLVPTWSLVTAEQRGGRVLRIDENKPDKFSTIVEFLGKDMEFSGAIMFSQVANGISFYRKDDDGQGPRRRDAGNATVRIKKDIKIEGLEVVVNTQEILTIQNNLAPRIAENEEEHTIIKDREQLRTEILKLMNEGGPDLASKQNDFKHLDKFYSYLKNTYNKKHWPGSPHHAIPGCTFTYLFYGPEKMGKTMTGMIKSNESLKKNVSSLIEREKIDINALKKEMGNLLKVYRYLRAKYQQEKWPGDPKKALNDFEGYTALLTGNKREGNSEVIKDENTLKADVQAVLEENKLDINEIISEKGTTSEAYKFLKAKYDKKTWPADPGDAIATKPSLGFILFGTKTREETRSIVRGYDPAEKKDISKVIEEIRALVKEKEIDLNLYISKGRGFKKLYEQLREDNSKSSWPNAQTLQADGFEDWATLFEVSEKSIPELQAEVCALIREKGINLEEYKGKARFGLKYLYTKLKEENDKTAWPNPWKLRDGGLKDWESLFSPPDNY